MTIRFMRTPNIIDGPAPITHSQPISRMGHLAGGWLGGKSSRSELSAAGGSIQRCESEQVSVGFFRCDPPLEHHATRTRLREPEPFHAGSVASTIREPRGLQHDTGPRYRRI